MCAHRSPKRSGTYAGAVGGGNESELRTCRGDVLGALRKHVITTANIFRITTNLMANNTVLQRRWSCFYEQPWTTKQKKAANIANYMVLLLLSMFYADIWSHIQLLAQAQLPAAVVRMPQIVETVLFGSVFKRRFKAFPCERPAKTEQRFCWFFTQKFCRVYKAINTAMVAIWNVIETVDILAVSGNLTGNLYSGVRWRDATSKYLNCDYSMLTCFLVFPCVFPVLIYKWYDVEGAFVKSQRHTIKKTNQHLYTYRALFSHFTQQPVVIKQLHMMVSGHHLSGRLELQQQAG